MASPSSLIAPAPTVSTPKALPLPPLLRRPRPTSASASTRRGLLLSLSGGGGLLLVPSPAAWAASEDEYKKETAEVIEKVRSTITLEKNDPKIAEAVSELREASNSWVAKYRREKDLLGRPSFRDIYSALNAVTGHYISFGPTAPIPAKRKQRILEEMDTAEKALQRGR
ncbi:photosystem II repair protein PSB27-H1, chloroplastic [Andrographis paniculata]|uniref:photosystem II repair protein PSB27-H1, chloroplastic n=1 Tax=Andrographis paniculata TaxID=175694 RepID=UPI0021E9A347|nr:photosystem II repair protein PSB27-H1, chloroplastic [Andrographis paniculata]